MRHVKLLRNGGLGGLVSNTLLRSMPVMSNVVRRFAAWWRAPVTKRDRILGAFVGGLGCFWRRFRKGRSRGVTRLVQRSPRMGNRRGCGRRCSRNLLSESNDLCLLSVFDFRCRLTYLRSARLFFIGGPKVVQDACLIGSVMGRFHGRGAPRWRENIEGDPSLREHFGRLHVLSREFTGVGSYTNFRVPEIDAQTTRTHLDLDALIVVPNV